MNIVILSSIIADDILDTQKYIQRRGEYAHKKVFWRNTGTTWRRI